jgi:hypothetical protein
MTKMASPRTIMEDATGEESPLLGEVGDSVADSSRSILSFDSAHLHSSARSISSMMIRNLSSSARQQALKNLGISPAAHLIRDAVLGEKGTPYEAWYDPYANPDQPFKNFVCVLFGRVLSHRWMLRVLRGAAWTLVLLSFIDPPHWCRNSDLDIVQVGEDNKFGTCGVIMKTRGTASDGEEDVEYYPNTDSMWLTVKQSEQLEWVCLGIITAFIILQFGRDGFELNRFFFPGHVRRKHSLRLFLLPCLYYGLLTRNTIYSPFFRIVLLGTYLKNFQKEMNSFIKMVRTLLLTKTVTMLSPSETHPSCCSGIPAASCLMLRTS